ncbi:MAG: hypothetical protein A2W01_01300 [Candidatus Solincola sediminis]|uniref:PBP domain-containing protein n=1 Tax=Candidatus Solincola sediminis TaxID=1797199 RepID=A0A1F2WHI1_9ACTN|nr:MAG: hypothetical protein A2Y75_03725 [Candidatus Solincola sediminis]OFW58756.1 MAG: hypothetical protein A2W01_01300 [Candidatus Solincola sediminis]
MRIINSKRLFLVGLIAVFLVAGLLPWLSGCGSGSDKRLIVAATSDLENSGILDAWMKDFKGQSGAQVELITDSDQNVLVMAMHGECDVLITHLPDPEQDLQKSNYIQGRQEIMHDDYVILGPPGDPGGVKDSPGAADAFKKIGNDKTQFVFRSDGSGTSYKETDLWGISGIEDFGDWMIQTESGMADTLRLASEKGAYTFSDRSTFERLSGELNLEIVFEDSEALANPYSVMEVSQLPFPDTNLQGGEKLAAYLASTKAQRHFKLGVWEPPSQTDE